MFVQTAFEDGVLERIQPGHHLLPGVVGVGRADDDLHLGVDLPEPLDRLHAVPSGRHAHIDKSHGIGLAGFKRAGNLGDAFAAAERRVELEPVALRMHGLAEQRRFDFSQVGRRLGARTLRKSSWIDGVSSISRTLRLDG